MSLYTGRYARAFADVVFERKLDPLASLAQLQSVVAIYESSEDLRRVWESPAISAEQKLDVLDAIVARMSGVPRALRNFVAVLIDHSRIASLALIAKQFETEINSRLGRIEADVTSSRPLSEIERAELVSKVSELTGSVVSARYSVDPALLGGATVRVGSTVYDGSVRGQLQKIKEQLSAE
jgi:F-type H+-transporting ATPase subunit delta